MATRIRSASAKKERHVFRRPVNSRDPGSRLGVVQRRVPVTASRQNFAVRREANATDNAGRGKISRCAPSRTRKEITHESCTRVWTNPTSSTRLTFGLNMVIQSEPSFLRSLGAVSGSKLEEEAGVAATSVGSFSSLTVAVVDAGPGVGVLATAAVVAGTTGGAVERGDVPAAASEPVTTEEGKAAADPEPTRGRGAGWCRGGGGGGGG